MLLQIVSNQASSDTQAIQDSLAHLSTRVNEFSHQVALQIANLPDVYSTGLTVIAIMVTVLTAAMITAVGLSFYRFDSTIKSVEGLKRQNEILNVELTSLKSAMELSATRLQNEYVTSVETVKTKIADMEEAFVKKTNRIEGKTKYLTIMGYLTEAKLATTYQRSLISLSFASLAITDSVMEDRELYLTSVLIIWDILLSRFEADDSPLDANMIDMVTVQQNSLIDVLNSLGIEDSMDSLGSRIRRAHRILEAKSKT